MREDHGDGYRRGKPKSDRCPLNTIIKQNFGSRVGARVAFGAISLYLASSFFGARSAGVS